MNDWHWVTHADAADALLEPTTFRYFAVFIGRELTLSEAARRLEVKRTTLRYHVARFVAWGVLRVTTSTRGNRTHQAYSAVSERFFVPFSVSSWESLEACAQAAQAVHQQNFVADYARAMEQDFREAARGGTVIHRRDHESISLDFTPTPPPDVNALPVTDRGLWSSWTTLHLTAQEARELEATLRAFWEQALERHGAADPSTKPFTLRLGLAPRQS
jgi:hypothetical protein